MSGMATSSIVAAPATLDRIAAQGQRSTDPPSGDMPFLTTETASRHQSTPTNRLSHDKSSRHSSERASFDRISHERQEAMNRSNGEPLGARSHQWDTSLDGQAFSSIRDGNILQKGAKGMLASGSYIVNTGHRSNAAGGSEIGAHSNGIDSRSRSDADTSDTSHNFEARSSGKHSSEPGSGVLDGQDAQKLTANGAITKPLPALESPLRDSITNSSRQRRAHSASNSDGPHTKSMYLDPAHHSLNRVSAPLQDTASFQKPASPSSPQHPRLQHRHTLQVPRTSSYRGSRELSWPNNNASEDAISSAINHAPLRRASLNLVRRTTRSAHSEIYMEDIPQDADAARWAEKIQQKRMSRHRRKEEEEDDRVMVGTKVDQNHVNWVTAYNMLTGIRFTVSRTNAKLDRDLTDADFEAKHKFSFDITGNELTPSAKYDFKFKDYAPWVFRHLRAQFRLDPADYLISLTSKYILSELGSPGKSGSFFYFSRDYKYIIKTIHHSEHKMLRKVLRQYYDHVQENPNTLISQFYGLHRVKIPRGRKIHFVVMNNLFPPHRDIHQTFDLKGSTIGRDFKEDELEKNPRATLKDLNWLRRNNHLELGPEKKRLFIEQLERDVRLLQRLQIMDYSLLVGIHDVSKGNDENLRDKTLQVFEPGGKNSNEDSGQRDGAGGLTRTPSKQEKARKARELRQAIKRERPVPMDKSTLGMPDTVLNTKKDLFFYSDDGGFQASHDDGAPGEEIYYLGIIDCLTRYGFVKRIENFIKGMSGHESQISPVPPDFYGERFIKFISGTTMSREEAERQKSLAQDGQGSLPIIKHSSNAGEHLTSQDAVMERAEREAARTSRGGAEEEEKPDRVLTTARSQSADRGNGGTAGTTLPVLEEVGESGSVGGRSRSAHSSRGDLRDAQRGAVSSQTPNIPTPPRQTLSPPLGGRPPPTPPKDPPRDLVPTIPQPIFVDSPITLEVMEAAEST